MNYLLHPIYKQTFHEWLGNVPATWEIKKLKFLSKIETGSKDTIDREVEGEFPFYVRSDVIERISTYSFDGEAILTAGDGVGAAKVFHYVNGKFDFHQRVYKICDFKKHYGKFLFYYLKENFQKEVLQDSINTTVDSLRRHMFLEFPVVIPGFNEQQTIAKFLDYKTAQIDLLIEKKEQLLKFLEEKRIALITNAVTGKLNNTILPLTKSLSRFGGRETQRVLKSSGIPWLGDIPKHWDVKRLRSLMKGKLSNGIFKKRDEWGFGTKLINVTDIYTNNFLVNTSNLTLVNCSNEELETYRVKDGDFFFVRSSLKLEGIGQSSSLIGNNEELVFECHLVKGSPNQSQINARFLNYFLNSSALRNYFISHANTVTMSTIDQSVFKDTTLCVPTLLEQQYIVEHLDIELAKIDLLSTKVTEAIEKLKEYRTSLITSAVTGKIDLRNWQPNNN